MIFTIVNKISSSEMKIQYLITPIILAFADGLLIEIDLVSELIISELRLITMVGIVRCYIGIADIKLIFSDMTELTM